jgi:hypothetical protein
LSFLEELDELCEDVLRIDSIDDGKPMEREGDAGADLGETPKYIAPGVISMSFSVWRGVSLY